MTREFGQLMVFLSYLVISYIVATSMRHTVLHIHDARERSVRLSFDSLVGLFLLVTGLFPLWWQTFKLARTCY